MLILLKFRSISRKYMGENMRSVTNEVVLVSPGKSSTRSNRRNAFVLHSDESEAVFDLRESLERLCLDGYPVIAR